MSSKFSTAQPKTTTQSFPVLTNTVATGFPSPADDYLEEYLNLNQHLIRHPAATFFMRVSGDSMIAAGLHPHDILIVDRSLTAKSGKIVIAVLEGVLIVRRLQQKNHRLFLQTANKLCDEIEITQHMEMVIWGVVTTVIHSV